MSHSRAQNIAVTIGRCLLLVGLTAAFQGCRDKTPLVPWKSGTTVIPGQFGWDVETDSIVHPTRIPTADLWWNLISEQEKYLTTMHGAAAAVVKNGSYEQIDGVFIRRQRLTEQRIGGKDEPGVLAPGTIIVFRTANGVFGKLQIIGYRSLHDFSFPQIAAYLDQWRAAALQRPDYERYHIEVKWQLYRPDQK
jgi:hypothetical protein